MNGAAVAVHRLPDGDPFAIVINSDARARVSASADGSAVTIVLQQHGRIPCSLIFPDSVAMQVFGAEFIAIALAEGSVADEDEPGTQPGGGL